MKCLYDSISLSLSSLEREHNMRTLPDTLPEGFVDFTSNDYLGLGRNSRLREEFMSGPGATLPLTSSASRLMGASQEAYKSLERTLSDSYGRASLLLNSGYHANTGIIPAIAGRGDFILADRLVHASIIDGCRLSGAQLTRFPHNDFDRLEQLVKKLRDTSAHIIVVVESVYSMDGDRADLSRLAEIKNRFPDIILYVDEAHAAGICGDSGLGESVSEGVLDSVDILVGTFGKALASEGAFVITNDDMRRFLINRCRSLIFSTALSPLNVAWSEHVWKYALTADDERRRLRDNAKLLAEIIPGGEPSHIRPLVIGDSALALNLSNKLREEGFNVLPIRTPTVPPGTERLRFSLSADIFPEQLERLGAVIKKETVTMTVRK